MNGVIDFILGVTFENSPLLLIFIVLLQID